MQDHHLHRILALLGDYDSRGKINSDRKYGGNLQPKWNHRTQWKWFFKDIGKQTCISALLPFAEMALYTSQTPLPAREKDTYYLVDVESRDSLLNKINLVIAWAGKPAKQNKKELAALLPLPKGYLGIGQPVQAAESFINNLIVIILAERKFQRHVDFAFWYLHQMGYGDSFADTLFKEKVLAIYHDRLNKSSNSPGGEACR